MNYGDTYKLFSNRDKAALCLQHTETEKAKYPTITIELAPITQSIPAWEVKTSLQLTRVELTAFCRTALGLIPSCEGNYHGAQKNKGFAFHNNGDKGCYVRVSEAGQTKSISLNPTERIELRAFVIARLATAWKMNVVDVLALLRYP